MTLAWTNCRVKLGELKPWASNPRMSTKAQAQRIIESFKRFGQVAPVAIAPDNTVYDGHQRLSALLTLYGADYEIDARRASRMLTDEEHRALALALANAVGQWDWNMLSGWQPVELKEWGFDGETLKGWNNDANNLKELLQADAPSVDATNEIIPEQFMILIICGNEQEQTQMLQRFIDEGLKCRALLS